MPDSIPNLAGVATKDLVETIGAGSFKASYINWARTFNLLHEHAPGWCLEILTAPDGGQVFRAPGNGGYLMLRFVHTDGTVLPAVPQAIMDNRNQPIAFDKISARDVTDTHRRGGCMAAAMTFGLAHELWAKMPLESGYGGSDVESGVVPAARAASPSQASPVASQAPLTSQKEVTMQDFLAACLDKGLTTHAADKLVDIVGSNFAGALKTLASKTAEWVAEQNAQAEPAPKSSKPAAKKTAKADPEEY
jgi:hypothetical protein